MYDFYVRNIWYLIFEIIPFKCREMNTGYTYLQYMQEKRYPDRQIYNSSKNRTKRPRAAIKFRKRPVDGRVTSSSKNITRAICKIRKLYMTVLFIKRFVWVFLDFTDNVVHYNHTGNVGGHIHYAF